MLPHIIFILISHTDCKESYTPHQYENADDRAADSQAQSLFDCGGEHPQFISFDLLNDNYCDCDETGIDEPSTSACNRGRFYCAPEDRYIFSSMVNDLLCDCCDGSDEWLNIENEMIECEQRCDQHQQNQMNADNIVIFDGSPRGHLPFEDFRILNYTSMEYIFISSLASVQRQWRQQQHDNTKQDQQQHLQ